MNLNGIRREIGKLKREVESLPVSEAANREKCIDQLINAARGCDSPIEDLTREEAALYFIAIEAQNDPDPCQSLINRARKDYGVTLRRDEAAAYLAPVAG